LDEPRLLNLFLSVFAYPILQFPAMMLWTLANSVWLRPLCCHCSTMVNIIVRLSCCVINCFCPHCDQDRSTSQDARGRRDTLYLVFIYDKSQLENISKDQIFEMLKKI
jgi:hypothetical protein